MATAACRLLTQHQIEQRGYVGLIVKEGNLASMRLNMDHEITEDLNNMDKIFADLEQVFAVLQNRMDVI